MDSREFPERLLREDKIEYINKSGMLHKLDPSHARFCDRRNSSFFFWEEMLKKVVPDKP